MASSLSPQRPNARLQHSPSPGSCFSRILALPYGPRTGGGHTGFPLKKVLPYFSSCLTLSSRILGHSSGCALAFLGTSTTKLARRVSLPLDVSSGGLPMSAIGPSRALPQNM